MCIALPMRVVESDGFTALCERAGRTRRVNTMLVGEVPPGTILSVFIDQALRTMTEEEAEETDRALGARRRDERVGCACGHRLHAGGRRPRRRDGLS